MQQGGLPSFWVHAESAALAQDDALYCPYDCAIVSANCVFDLSFISGKYRCVLAVGIMSCTSFNSIVRYRRVQYHQFLVSKVLHVRNAFSVMVKSAAARIQKDPALWNLCDELMLASISDHLNRVIVSIELLIL